jgi:TRAP-type C4-dicarboxylate transport system substrate-binding protein
MKTGRYLLLGGVLVALLTCFFAQPFFARNALGAEPIKLNFVSFVPVTNKVEYQKFKADFIDKVNNLAKGELIITVKGGPEAIPPFNLGISLQRGVIDLATIPAAFLEALVPGANQTSLSDYTASEERKNGIYEYIQEMYKKAGLFYLGRGEATEPEYFYLFLTKKAEKESDFKGLKLGGSTAFHGFYNALGASIATIAIPEYHSAMERGVVDGIATSPYVGLQFGLHEVSKCLIKPGVYRSTVSLPVNLKTWAKLPKHLQDLMLKCMVEFENEYSSYEAGERAAALRQMQSAGVQIVPLSGATETWYLNAAREGAWKDAEKRFPGDVIPNLRKRITK